MTSPQTTPARITPTEAPGWDGSRSKAPHPAAPHPVAPHPAASHPAAPHLPAPHAGWQAWLHYGLAWAQRDPVSLAALWVDLEHWVEHAKTTAVPAHELTVHAYLEETPGPRWQALFQSTWPAYRAWYLSEGSRARPCLSECQQALRDHMPELVPTWERLCALSGHDADAAKMLSMWRLPAFAVGCAQTIVPGTRPLLVRNYDYDQALFEAVIASTNYSGARKVIGTSDLLWGLLDGMNSDGLTVSLTFGGRPGSGPGFGIPLVLRYLLEVCGTVGEAIDVLRRIPVSQSYNVALADTSAAHATVFVAPDEEAVVSRIESTTNHRLGEVEHVERAMRLNSLGRQRALNELRSCGVAGAELVAAMRTPPLRNEEFGQGFGTLYTAEYRPAEPSVTWHWPDTSWQRSFDDLDAVRTVRLS